MKITVFYGLLIILLAFSFISCGDDNGNGDFTSSTNDTTLNNIPTLGLVGTTASSSNTNVATVETPPTNKIKITSVSEGSAIITVSDGTNNATINVSVSKTGSITIGTITKYVESGPSLYAGDWVWEAMNVKIVINGDLTFSLWLQGTEFVKGNIQIEANNATLTYTSLWDDVNETWTDDQDDIAAAAPVIGTPPIVGTINGHSTGSTLIITFGGEGVFIKQ